MSVRRLALLTVLGVLAGVLVWLPGQLRGTDSASPSASVPPAGPGVVSTPGAAPSPGSSSEAGGATSDSVGAGSSGGKDGGPGASTEILPQPSSAPASGTQDLPGLKPPKSTTAPLVTSPLPQGATRTGALVDGYPSALAPPTATTIEISSVSPAGDVLQVGLTANCTQPCAVLRSYRLRLAARGFTEVAAASVENRPSASFQRGSDSVTVSITGETRSALEYAVFGVLHTEEG